LCCFPLLSLLLSHCLLPQTNSTYGFNRLSRFQYDPLSPTNTRNSEEILIDTIDKNYRYHSAGWIGFKPSAYESDNVSLLSLLGD